MRTPGWTVMAILAVMTLGACDRAPDEALVTPDRGGPAAASSSAGPAASGVVILARPDTFSTIQFILIFDAERELLAAHMPSDICGDGAFNVVRFQRLRTPSAIGQVIAKQTGDGQVAIYRASSLAEAGLASDISFISFSDLVDIGTFCSFMSGPNRIAEGTVNLLATFSFASFHARWIGTIQGVDGQDYRLTEIYQLNADIFDPNNVDTFTEPVVEILLRPIP
jgi:hypothetical protein